MCGERSVSLIDNSSGLELIGTLGITLSTLGDLIQFAYKTPGLFSYKLSYSLAKYP